jgi:energy-coupling factor transporter transmembrane protein EcfT
MLGTACALALALNLLFSRGEPLPIPPILGWRPSAAGLALGALMGLRLVAAALAIHGLAAAWPGERAADAIAGMASPLERLRVPVARTRAILGLALRFAPLLADEVARIQRIQTLRSGKPARSLADRLERTQATVVPAVVGALERAERVALTLEARHYRARPVPTPAVRPLAAAAGGLIAGVSLFWRG